MDSTVNCHAPDFDVIAEDGKSSCCIATLTAFRLVVACCRRLGCTMRLNVHRSLIDDLSQALTDSVEVGSSRTIGTCVADDCLRVENLARAFSVCFTALEQAYHWPCSEAPTPSTMSELKFIVHHVVYPQLRSSMERDTDDASPFAESAIAHSNRLMSQLSLVTDASEKKETQFLVNLLFRSSQQDIVLQQSAGQPNRKEMEFGALHEAVFTNGTMRLMGEVYQRLGGMSAARSLLDIGDAMPVANISAAIVDVCTIMQSIIVQLTDLIFRSKFDLPVWGATYLRFAKAVPPSTLDGTGVDTSAIHLVDAVMGYCNNAASETSELMEIHRERCRYLPPHLESMIRQLVSHRVSVTHLLNRIGNNDKNSLPVLAYAAVTQQFYGLLEMHRKLALGIIVATRTAGIRTTAAGFAKDDSPSSSPMKSRPGSMSSVSPATDLHLVQRVNHALRSSMQVRFGAAMSVRAIPASARVVRPIFAEDAALFEGATGGELVGAVVEIQFPVQLFVQTGDRLCISINETCTEEKKFTVIRGASSFASSARSSKVHISVKNFHGPVTSLLCRRSSVSDVFVRTAPTPRNRNLLQQEDYDSGTALPVTTVFITQGSASCGPIEWVHDLCFADLSGTLLSVASTRRVFMLICCRDWNSVPLRDKVTEIVSRNRKISVDVVFVLSQPRPDDEPRIMLCLDGSGLTSVSVFCGRIDAYFEASKQVWRFADVSTGYISGGSAFGMNVAHCLHGMRSVARFARSGAAESLGRFSKFKFDVYNKLDVSSLSIGMPDISLAQLAMHNNPATDAWVAIKGFVYNVTSFMGFHPGGQAVLTQHLGLDASRMFNKIHGGCIETSGMLKPLVVGKLAVAEATDRSILLYACLDAWVCIQNTACNTSRCVAWPTAACVERSNEAPPLFFLLNGLSQFAEALKTYEKDFLASDSSSAEICFAVASFCRLVQGAALTVNTADAAECHEATVLWFGRIAVLWDEVHAAFDAAKRDVCLATSLQCVRAAFDVFATQTCKVVASMTQARVSLKPLCGDATDR